MSSDKRVPKLLDAVINNAAHLQKADTTIGKTGGPLGLVADLDEVTSYFTAARQQHCG